MYLSTPHAHTTYVDGKSSPREMAEAAVAKGFCSLGFSEHAEQPNDPQYGLKPDTEQAYRREIQALAAEYAGRLRIRLGLERDAFSPADRSRYEYVIGSVHYVRLNGGGYASVDGDPDALARALKTEFSGDGIAYVKAYYDTLASYVETFRPEIIGHFDLVRKWNEKLRIFDSADRAYRDAAFEALERMIASGALLEVNTGAMARGRMSDPYPEAFLLARWRELGGRAIVGTDCHFAEKLDYGMEAARERCLEAGYRSVCALSQGDCLFEEYPL